MTEGFPLIRIRDITSGCTETRYNGPFDDSYIVNNGDLLVGMDGDFNIRLWDGYDALLNQGCCKIIEEQGVIRSFLFYCLPFRLKWVNDLTYATTVKHLSTGDIAETVMFAPSVSEQRRIADFLDRKCSEIDAVIEKTKITIEEYKKLKQSIITEAVTKGVRGPRKMKDSGIEWVADIADAWVMSRIGPHYSIVLGKMLCDKQLTEEYTLEPYFCAANIHFDGVSQEQLKQMWFSPAEKVSYCIQNGDLLVVEGGAGAGGAAIVDVLE